MNFPVNKKWVDIVFLHPPWQRFTYQIPERFNHEINLGYRVLVPLGRRKMTGFVIDFVDSPGIEELREIEDMLDPYPLLTSDLLKLTQWISTYYFTSWGEVIKAALPPGIHRKHRRIVRFCDKNEIDKESLSRNQEIVLSYVSKVKKISFENLQKKYGEINIRSILRELEKLQLIQIEYVLENVNVQIKSEKWISLVADVELPDVQVLKRRAPKQAKLLNHLMQIGGEVRRCDLPVDYSTIRRLEKKGWIEIWEEEVFRDPYLHVPIQSPKSIRLTEEQKNVISTIVGGLKSEQFKVFLLHGVTSSGKTQVYIETVRQVLSRGKSALILIPEIALTPQAVQRYRSVFSSEVAILHSKMSPGERYDSWRKIREGQFKICLGPRSAVFAPLRDLGLIVVDEEHEDSYKQIDPAPRYHARDVAVIRGKMNNCVVLLGSATPSIESYTNALEGKYTLCELKHRIDHVPLPQITLVDQNQVFKKDQAYVFSPLLRDKIEDRLSRGEQVILLQNRRGYATFLRCQACGAIESCPHCNISLTYHQKNYRLRCHYCGFQKAAPDDCEKCGGATLRYRGVGTQRVEEEVRKCFPYARFFRMDLDTTRRKGAHYKIVTEFEKRKGDILIGTQMVAKGHDFPGVNLVGIISADTGLYFPDFRSGERTFRLLTQAAGRAGRRKEQGEVIVQTYSPDNPILRFAVNQSYNDFYKWESEQRKELNYPPWGRFIGIRFKGKVEERVAQAAHTFVNYVQPDNFFECLGPISSPLSKIKGMYRYQIMFRGNKSMDPSGKNLRKRVKRGLNDFYEKTRFPNVRISVDVDPIDMM